MHRLIHFLFLTLILVGCSKDELEYQNEFDKSYKTWLQYKQNNKSYSYTSQTTSWIGITTHTTITVENNQVTKREFKHARIGSKAIPENGWTKQLAIEALKEIGYTESEIPSIFGSEIIDKLQWVENKADLGKNGYAEQLMTLEQIYEKAKNDWITKRPKSQIYFEAKNNGLISTAGYVLDGCMDDCFVGIKIINIQNLN